MPPKSKVNTAATPQPEEEPTIADLYKLMKSHTTTLEEQSVQLAAVKTLVQSLTEENKELKTAIKQKDEQLSQMAASMCSLEEKVNNLEQHHRGWSARAHNIPLSSAEEANPSAVIDKVYRLALLPILEGAHLAGELRVIPTADEVLEVAHVLPGKQGYPKPVIMRFYNRNLRNLVFKHKRDSAPRAAVPSAGRGGGGSERLGKLLYPLFDDLTRINYAKMKAIGNDERVQACWSVGGQIRFKLHDSDVVKKVNSVFDPLDKIIK
jgi:uncharacterized protein YoxC